MKKISINKAQAILSDTEVESVTISLTKPVPDCKDLQQQAEFFDCEAELLAKTLSDTLPAGTMDRLIVELLKSRLSLFLMSYGEIQKWRES